MSILLPLSNINNSSKREFLPWVHSRKNVVYFQNHHTCNLVMPKYLSNKVCHLIYMLIDYLRIYVPLKIFSRIWRRHHCLWRAAKFRPMLGAEGLWTGRDLYRATPAVARDLSFSGLNRSTPIWLPLTTHKVMWKIYSNRKPLGALIYRSILILCEWYESIVGHMNSIKYALKG
jgi:hypothetical protein